MKKPILILIVALFTITTFAQTKKAGNEILYFKAELACCRAKACNALEADVKKIIEKNYPDGKIAFRQVKLSDPANSELVKKYEAKSQSLVLIVRKKKTEKSLDLSAVLQDYTKTGDLVKLEKELVAKINEALK